MLPDFKRNRNSRMIAKYDMSQKWSKVYYFNLDTNKVCDGIYERVTKYIPIFGIIPRRPMARLIV